MDYDKEDDLIDINDNEEPVNPLENLNEFYSDYGEEDFDY